MVRKNVGEGAERPLKDDDYISTIRGGQSVRYIAGYPHPSGSWIPK